MSEKRDNRNSQNNLPRYKDQDINVVSKGMYLDSPKEKQPEGTSSFTLNGVNESIEGDHGDLINERGNLNCIPIPKGYQINGHISLLDDKFVVFLVNETEGISQIGIADGVKCSYDLKISSKCLGFRIDKQIQGIYRIRNGCELNIYFTDWHNPTRAINLDKLNNYVNEGRDVNIPIKHPNTNSDGWNCDLMKLFPDFKHPCVNLIKVNDSGGANVKVGTYQIVLRYLDADGNPTPWFDPSPPIPIYDERVSSSKYSSIDGGFHTDDPSNFLGVPSTNKSISYEISDLDQSFSFVEIAVITYTTGNGVTPEIYVVNKLPIISEKQIYLFTGINFNTATILTLDEILQTKLGYETCKTLTTIDNRLVIGNIKEKNLDFSLFQKKANEICTMYVTKPQEAEKINGLNGKGPLYYEDTRSYMGDEVYAYSISWIFNDGFETPAYHIPGRQKNKDCEGELIDPRKGNINTHNRPKANTLLQEWDSELVKDNKDTQHYINCEGDTGCLITDDSSPDDIGGCPIIELTYKEIEKEQDETTEKCYIFSFNLNGTYPSSSSEITIKLSTPANPDIPRAEETYNGSGVLGPNELCFELTGPSVPDDEGNQIFVMLAPGVKIEIDGVINTLNGCEYVIDYTTIDIDHKVNEPKKVVFLPTEKQVPIPAPAQPGFEQSGSPVVCNGISASIEIETKNGESDYVLTLSNVPTNLDSSSNLFVKLESGGEQNIIILDYLNILDGVYNYSLNGADPTAPASIKLTGNILTEDFCEYEFDLDATVPESEPATIGRKSDQVILTSSSDKYEVCVSATASQDLISDDITIDYQFLDPVFLDPNSTITLIYGGIVIDTRSLNDLDNYTVPAPNGTDDLEIQINAIFTDGQSAFYSLFFLNSELDGIVIKEECQYIDETNPTNVNNCVNSNTFERWEIYNTAIRTQINNQYPNPNTDGETFYTKGLMAYWESCELYPSVLDCNGFPIYPHTITDTQSYPEEGSYTMDKVRHHKMPDRTLEPHIYNEEESPLKELSINPIGLMLSDIEPPDEYKNQIVGYKIHRAKRDEANKSILDKGLMLYSQLVKCLDSPELIMQGAMYNFNRSGTQVPATSENYENLDSCGDNLNSEITPRIVNLHVPENKFFKDSLNASFLKIELEMWDEVEYFQNDTLAPRVDPFTINTSACEFQELYIPPINLTNRRIEEQSTVDFDSNNNFSFLGVKFDNSRQQETLVVKTNHNINFPESYSFTADNEKTEDQKVAAYYTSLKVLKPNQYGSLDSILYQPIHNCVLKENKTPCLFGGDIFISRLDFRKTLNAFNYETPSLPEPDGPAKNIERHLVTFYTESSINTELRHTDDITDDCQLYYPKHFSNKPLFLDVEKYNDITGVEEIPDLCSNYYAYNKDFSRELCEAVKVPLSSTFDFCSDCLNEYPHRIAWSQKSYQEEKIDHFKNFLPNDYRDIPSHRGIITNLWVKSDTLFCHTERSLWRLFTKEQQLQSNTAAITVGTGEFFDIPPKELVTSDGGYAGSNSQWGININEHGAFFPDKKTGTVFKFTDQLNEISNTGLKNFLEENLPVKLENQYRQLFNSEWLLHDNPANPIGTGIEMTYDPRHKRILLVKKDYIIADEYTSNIIFSEDYGWLIRVECPLLGVPSPPKGAITFPEPLSEIPEFLLNSNGEVDEDRIIKFGCECNPNEGEYNIETCKCETFLDDDNGGEIPNTGKLVKFDPKFCKECYIQIEPSEDNVFEDNSFTLSYSMLSNTWVSFHNYCPRHMVTTTFKWFTFLNDLTWTQGNNGWEHNYGQFQTYYDKKYPFIFEFISSKNPIKTDIYFSTEFIANVSEFDTVRKTWMDVPNSTFNKVVLYNDEQTTGVLNIKPLDELSIFDDIDYLPNIINVRRTDRTWKFNDIRSYRNHAINEPIFTSEWDDIKIDYFIDKVVNSNVVDYMQTQFNIERFRDKYLTTRLIFDNPLNRKMNVKYLLNNIDTSFR